MLILLPLNGDTLDSSQLSALSEVKKFALVNFEEGQRKSIEYFETFEEIQEWIDIVIVVSDAEYVWPFMERQISVLVAHHQREIDDVLEAYLFKELHELSM